MNRRTFLSASAATALASSASAVRGVSPNETVRVALMGVNSRGSQLAERIANLPDLEIAFVCDPDERALAKGIRAATIKGANAPRAVRDFRVALDDPSIDALICAAPNHWHAAATILACEAGKHVYVEKPCSHTAAEGELMIRAAERTSRVVQVGMQRRSSPLYREAVERIRSGDLGEARYAKSWYFRDRPSIGQGAESPPPAWLDFDLWQGPVTERPYRDNLLHYNWHFFWHWGDGELGNNGVHTIDICRWALGVDFPSQVTVTGGRVRYDDDQETPDTIFSQFQCGKKLISWEAVSWSPPVGPDNSVGIEIRGDKGIMRLGDDGYAIYDNTRRLVERRLGDRGDDEHLQDFVISIRDNSPPNANLDEGHRSALFCHLGNIAYRLGETLDTDSSNGHILDNPSATELWQNDYREGWATMS